MPNACIRHDLFARTHVGGVIELVDYIHAEKKKTPTKLVSACMY